MSPPTASPRPTRTRAFTSWDPSRATGRLVWSAGVGACVFLSVPERYGGPLRTVAAWDSAALILLILAWSIILSSGPEETARRAAAQDVGRTLVWVLVLLSSTFSIFAANVALRNARNMAPLAARALVVLCILAVAVAWFLCHTGYTLRYAHLFYREDGDLGGLTFPGTDQPCDLDFAYYAFTVGMCFQVSDVVVTQYRLRRATLGHALLSFAYNSAVLSLAINLLFGQMSG
jgi:uncharacterized membrane protein